MKRIYTREEVGKHNKEDDAWIIIDHKVFDITKFIKFHPGGKHVLLNEAGKDVSEIFDLYHAENVLQKYEKRLCIGEVEKKKKKEKKKDEKYFGKMVPHGDAYWYQGHYSPYFNKSHRDLRKAARAFMEKEVLPYAAQWDETMKFPKDLHQKIAKAGLYVGFSGKQHPEYASSYIAGGVKMEEWDYFHEMIMMDEFSRCGSGGVSFLLTEGIVLGSPPLMEFGTKKLKDRIAGPMFRGEKMICLAITEPYAGSDVAKIRCTAKKTEDGKHYIVNGEKKWITGGTFSDYFVTAVRTGKGRKGISLLVIEREHGVKTKHMKCSSLWASGTAFVTFDNVKVPVENLLGEEGNGFKMIMYNFNHERFYVSVVVLAEARLCYEEAFKWANQRRVFGKPLIDNAVVRNKLGKMICEIEASQSWLEHIVFQMCKMPHTEAMKKLGGEIGLLKAQTCKVLEYCSREGGMIFGGLSYTRGGKGRVVETLYRDAKGMTILAGTEDVMIDLAVRQNQKAFLRSKL